MKYAVLSRDIPGNFKDATKELIRIAYILSIISNFHEYRISNVAFGFIGGPDGIPVPGLTFSYNVGYQENIAYMWHSRGQGQISFSEYDTCEHSWKDWTSTTELVGLFMKEFHKSIGYEKCPMCRL